MKLGSLCTGVGGLDVAVSALLGADLAWYAEVDEHADLVFSHHHPGVKNLGDIKLVPWHAVDRVDVLCAGYPCQPFSQAGRRLAHEDPRHLWPWIADAIRALAPRLVVLENVRGHLRRGLDRVLGDLADLGYDANWGCVKAADAGAPHRRERVFIVARPTDGGGFHVEGVAQPAQVSHTGGTGDGGADSRADVAHPHGEPGVERWLAADGEAQGGWARADADRPVGVGASDLVAPDANKIRRNGWGRDNAEAEGRRESAYGGDVVADSTGVGHAQLKAFDGTQGSLGVEPGDHAGRCSLGVYEPAVVRWEALTRPAPEPLDERGRLNPWFVEWMMGFPEGWVCDHVKRRDALRLLGNAVVPQQAALALGLLA